MKKSIIAVALSTLCFNSVASEQELSTSDTIAAGILGAGAVVATFISGSSSSSNDSDYMPGDGEAEHLPEGEAQHPIEPGLADMPQLNPDDVDAPIKDSTLTFTVADQEFKVKMTPAGAIVTGSGTSGRVTVDTNTTDAYKAMFDYALAQDNPEAALNIATQFILFNAKGVIAGDDSEISKLHNDTIEANKKWAEENPEEFYKALALGDAGWGKDQYNLAYYLVTGQKKTTDELVDSIQPILPDMPQLNPDDIDAPIKGNTLTFDVDGQEFTITVTAAGALVSGPGSDHPINIDKNTTELYKVMFDYALAQDDADAAKNIATQFVLFNAKDAIDGDRSEINKLHSEAIKANREWAEANPELFRQAVELGDAGWKEPYNLAFYLVTGEKIPTSELPDLIKDHLRTSVLGNPEAAIEAWQQLDETRKQQIISTIRDRVDPAKLQAIKAKVKSKLN